MVIDAPLPVQIAVGAKQFTPFEPLAISSDGHFVAYEVQDGTRIVESPSNEYTKSGVPTFFQGCEVMLTDLQTGRTVSLTKGLGTSWGPVWSHSGRYIAFFSTYGGAVHVWTWDRLSGIRRQISRAIVHQASTTAIQWVDGDAQLLVPVLPVGMSVADADGYDQGYLVERHGRTELSHGSIRVYTNDPKAPHNADKLARLQGYDGSSNGDPFDYALVNVANGTVTRILRHSTAFAIAVSDDQRYGVVMTLSGAAADARDQGLYDLTVISLRNGSTKFAIRHLPMAANWSPSWQPGTDSFVYTTGGRYSSFATKQHGETRAKLSCRSFQSCASQNNQRSTSRIRILSPIFCMEYRWEPALLSG